MLGLLSKHIPLVLCLGAGALAQNAKAAPKVDFRRDVQPIFQAHCIACHGPKVQSNGLRLDRRRDAMRGGTTAVIGQGNSAGSRLYLKLIGNQFGPQMPPTGALEPEQISIIKDWLDQGAEWPDDAAGDVPVSPPSAAATRVMHALRDGDTRAFQKLLEDDPSAANQKGVGGTTPLMYAARYGDANSVRQLLDAGADANARNESGLTPLMWGLADVEITRVLLEHKANPNARTENSRTPLLIASSSFNSAPVGKLLLDAGADPNGAGLRGVIPLNEAANLGDESLFRLLLERGSDIKRVGGAAMAWSMEGGCQYCFETLMQSATPQQMTAAATSEVPPGIADATRLKVFLDHGANPKSADNLNRTLLMGAASSDAIPTETVKDLIARGADLNAKGPRGATALDFARLHGNTPVVEALVSAGALAEHTLEMPVPKPAPAASVREAIVKALPALQQINSVFLQKTGCLSCHNNSLVDMAVSAARKKGIPVNTQMEKQQVKATVEWLENWRDRVVQGIPIPGDVDTTGYVLAALADEAYSPDAATDALAHFLKIHQTPEGKWRLFAYRPPLESSEIEVTAMAVRSLHMYAPKPQRAEYEKAVQRASVWLAQATPKLNEDRVFQLLGLHWGAESQNNGDKSVIRQRGAELLALQRADGGWSQIPSLASDSYATGQALYALHQAGVLSVNDKAYQRGVEFLRNSQLADGSWYVKSRALTRQPYFESGFPHGVDQFISAAGTNWAVLALVPAAK